MEEIQKINEVLPSTISKESLTLQFQGAEQTRELSIYQDSQLTNDCLKESMKKLKLCFPKMQSEFFIILSDRLMANGFTNQRLIDAVNFVIDNNPYPEIMPGAVLGYDKRIKLKTYAEIVNEGNRNYPSAPGKMFEFYKRYKKIEEIRDGKTEIKFLYASITDIEIYKLKTIE